jgi:hypothetical protein
VLLFAAALGVGKITAWVIAQLEHGCIAAGASQLVVPSKASHHGITTTTAFPLTFTRQSYHKLISKYGACTFVFIRNRLNETSHNASSSRK